MADRRLLIDPSGFTFAPLTPAEAEQYRASLDLPADGEVIAPSYRLKTLAQLRQGAGVTVYTGPAGAPFWSLASIEVKVRVEPDGYEFEERTTDLTEWSLGACGVPATVAKRLAGTYSGEKPPTKNHRMFGVWEAAADLRVRLAQQRVGPAIIVEAFATEGVTDPAEQLRLLDNIREYQALDWEWHKTTKRPLGLSVATAARTWYLPLEAADFRLPDEHGDTLRAKVAEILRRPHGTVWHNAKSDLQTQYPGDPLDFSGLPIDDTLVMAFVAGLKALKLKELARSELGRDPMDYPKGQELANLPVELARRYAGADARNTYDLREKLADRLAATRQTAVYEEIERPVIPVLASMEKYGAHIDSTELLRLRAEMHEEEEAIRAEVLSLGYDLSDDDQTRDYIKSKVGWRPGSLRKDAISKIQGEWMDRVLHYRRLRHRRRAFVDKYLERWTEAGSPPTFVGYTNFNQAGGRLHGDARGFKLAPRTGRLSSSSDKDDPTRPGLGNLQNPPRDIRSAFVAPEGCVWWSFDYSGLELHIAAARSGDPLMRRTLLTVCPDGECSHRPKCGDLHDAFLYRIIDLSGVDVGRTVAKQGNFEQLYGGGADKLVTILAAAEERAFITYEMAKLVVDAHRQTFAGYHGYAGNVIAEARSNGGWAFTIDGRGRNEAADLFGDDPDRRAWAERALVNMTIQGTAADILKRAMDWSVPLLRAYGAHMAIQVHDELCGYVPVENAEPFARAMKALMASVPLPGLRLKVDGGSGPSWAAAK